MYYIVIWYVFMIHLFVFFFYSFQIEVCFLPKGHTHVDVDQMFSRLSVAIQRSGCLTYQDLLKLLRGCYKQNQGETSEGGATIQYAEMDQIFAIREWLIPHMEPVHALLEYHHFRFTREGQKCTMDYKPWCKGKIICYFFQRILYF